MAIVQETELSRRLAALGVTLAAKHSRLVSREADGTPVEWPHDEWRVTLAYGGRSYSTSFKQGIGHRKLEHGVKREGRGDRHYTNARGGIYFRDAVDVAEQGFSKPLPPTCADVVSCLVRDADCDDTFESWCADLGMDSDSRKAFAMYQECLRTRHTMLAMFGRELLTELQGLEH